MTEIEKLVQHYGIDKQALNDLLDIWSFLEDENKSNVSQAGGGPGGGFYQLESGSEEGGFQRLKNGYLNIPKEVTPEWMGLLYEEAKKNNKSVEAENYSKEQQDFIMAAYLLQDQNTLEVLQNVSQETDESTKLDMIVNSWLDTHWAGWQDHRGSSGARPETVRREKKNNALQRINRNYKKDPNWISMSDGLGYNFNMNNYA